MKQTDSIYWKQFKAGDQEALGKIFYNYFHELYFYGVKILPVADLVKDVIQEMFVRLWDRRESIGEVVNVKPYLLVTLRNELIRAAKENRFAEMEISLKSEPFILAVDDFMIREESSKELNQRLVNSLNQLSDRQREVILLRFYHNLEFEELAEVMEMKVQSVRNLLFRSLEKIRKDFKKTDFHISESIEIILFNFFQKK